jgi:CHAT domain-containing protein/tetratricopeptide (TPR) repeat protein
VALVISIYTLFFAAAWISGCARHSQISPAVLYQDARQKMQQGDLAPALGKADQGLAASPDENTEWNWRFRVLKSEILLKQGAAKESLALLEAAPPPNLTRQEFAVRRKIVQGTANNFLQRFEVAAQCLSDARELATSSHPELLGEVFLASGSLSLMRSDLGAAEASYRAALQFAREKNQSFLEAAALGDLGLIAMRKQHFDEAIDLDASALKVSESLGAQSFASSIRGNLGWNYFQMGDYEKALSYSTEAEEQSSKLGMRMEQIPWLTNIGSISLVQADYPRARDYYLKALALARERGNMATVTECLNNLAFTALEQEQFDLAEQYNREALDLVRRNHDRFGEPYAISVNGRIAAGRKDYRSAERLFLEVINDSAAEKQVHWEAQASLAKLYEEENRPALAERQFRGAMESIDEARSSLVREEFRLSFLSGAISFYDDYIGFLSARGRTVEALEVAELSRARTLAEGLGVHSGSLTFPSKGFAPVQVAKRLNTVILSYWLGPHRSYLWVVTPARVSSFVLPPAVEIAALVQSYRKTLVGPRDAMETENADGKKLYEILIAPVKELIPRGSRVTILPDNSLYALNFEALLVPAPNTHYWIEDVTVTTANSLVLLAASAPGSRAGSKNLLLIGDTIAPNAEFPKLPQAALEMSRIEKYFSPSDKKVLSGDQATPAAYFESRPENFSNIHFVAHGTASRISPLDSAVVLTRTGDSYKLYARDIIQQRLRADLVTISACRGAGDRTYSGEGLVGLTWAFLRAGAHSVIAALWEVNDNSTPQLMDQVYSEMSRGTSPDAALRDAKLSLIHSGTVYRKPFYWAPFQIYGGS